SLQITRILIVPVIHFLRPLVAAELNLSRIQHNHVVAVINVRRPGRLMLPRKHTSDTNGERAQACAGSIDDVPVVLSLCSLLLISTHKLPRDKKRKAPTGQPRDYTGPPLASQGEL